MKTNEVNHVLRYLTYETVISVPVFCIYIHKDFNSKHKLHSWFDNEIYDMCFIFKLG